MYFYKEGIFHIYNQGNNRKQIFYSRNNYEYFKWKMKAHLLPFGDLIAWCLMPNHFHLLFLVEQTDVEKSIFKEHYNILKEQRKKSKYESIITSGKLSQKIDSEGFISLNQSIGSMLSSYTQAINKSFGWSGSLFRGGCNAKDCWKEKHYGSCQSQYNDNFMEMTYVQRCFEYIHNNPSAAGLVMKAEDYEWSSAMEYQGLTEETLVNVDLGIDLVGEDRMVDFKFLYRGGGLKRPSGLKPVHGKRHTAGI